MWRAIKYNFSNLTNFSGRDARSTFWYYVLILVIIWTAVGYAIAIPTTVSMVSQGIDAVQSGVDPDALEEGMFEELIGFLKIQMVANLVMSFIMVALMMASMVRRLHDSGKPGWIAAIIIILFLGTNIASFAALDLFKELLRLQLSEADPQAIMEMQGKSILYSIPAWISYVLVIIFGVLNSDDGPNKYGDKPVQF